MNIRKFTGGSENIAASFFRPDQEYLTSTKTGKPKSSEKRITIHQSTRCHITEENCISNRYTNLARNVLCNFNPLTPNDL
jgi:hypothetical protein